MSKIEESSKKESGSGGRFNKEESLRRIKLFLEPVLIFKYCTRSQLMEIGKEILGFLAVRWMVDYYVETGYLAVHRDTDFGVDIFYLTPKSKVLLKQKEKEGWMREKWEKLVARYSFDRRYANMINFRHHNLLVGGYLGLAKQVAIKAYTSDWMLRGERFKAKIIPDAIVECEGLKIAVEAEILPRKLELWKTTIKKYHDYVAVGNVQGVLIIALNNAIYENIRNRIFFASLAHRNFSMRTMVITTLDMLKEGRCFYHNQIFFRGTIDKERLIKINDLVNNHKKYKLLNRQEIRRKHTTQEIWAYDVVLRFIDREDKEEENKQKAIVLGNEIRISEVFRILKDVKDEDKKTG